MPLSLFSLIKHEEQVDTRMQAEDFVYKSVLTFNANLAVDSRVEALVTCANAAAFAVSVSLLSVLTPRL